MTEDKLTVSAYFRPPDFPGWALVFPLIANGRARQYRSLWGDGSVVIEGDEITFVAHPPVRRMWLIPVAIVTLGFLAPLFALWFLRAEPWCLLPAALSAATWWPVAFLLHNHGSARSGVKRYSFKLDTAEGVERHSADTGFCTITFAQPLYDTARVRFRTDTSSFARLEQIIANPRGKP